MRDAFVARERALFRRRCGAGCSASPARVSMPTGSTGAAGPDKDARRRDLKRCHADNRGLYGRPRRVTDLREFGHAVGPQRVTRLMREEGLRGKPKAARRRARRTAITRARSPRTCSPGRST